MTSKKKAAAPAPPMETGARNDVLYVRLSSEEKDVLHQAAVLANRSLADWARLVLLTEAKKS